jgi:uncharacterized integral membrane protein
MTQLKFWAVAMISLVVLIVVLQNTQVVERKLLFRTVTIPNAALLFGTWIIGFAIGVLTASHIVSIVRSAPRVLRAINSRTPRHEPSAKYCIRLEH